MKKVGFTIIPVAILLIGLVLFFGNGDRAVREKKISDYEKVMSVDLYGQYPTTPTGVVELYCMAEKLLFSTDFEKEDGDKIGDLIDVQCKLYDDELIDYNGGKELIKINARDQSKAFLEKGYKIIETKIQTSSSVEADEEGNPLRFVNVIQYVNKGDNSYKMYCLRKDSKGKWKILTFQDIDEFTIG